MESTENQSFGWSVFPGYTILGLLRESRRKLTKDRITLEEFKDRIIFMSMCNGIDWTTGGNLEMCISKCSQVKANAKCFPKDIGQSPHQGQKKNGMERTPTSQKVCGTALQI